MWEVTSKRLEAFLPGLLEQVFPGAGEARPTPAVEVSREEVEAKMNQKVQEVEGSVDLPVRPETELVVVLEEGASAETPVDRAGAAEETPVAAALTGAAAEEDEPST